MSVRPLTGQVLLRVLPSETVSAGGIVIPEHTLSPEEHQERNHHPDPPGPVTAQVVAVGPWKRLRNGLALIPPISPNSKVLIRPGCGQQLSRGVNEQLRLVKVDDVLAVLT